MRRHVIFTTDRLPVNDALIDAMVVESRDRLVKACAELRSRINQSGPQERLFTGANRDGFGSVADLLRALD